MTAALARVLVDAYGSAHSPTPIRDAVLDPAIGQAMPAFAGLPEELIATGLMAWTSVFGLVSFELFGHLVASVADPADFFASQVEVLADRLGLVG